MRFVFSIGKGGIQKFITQYSDVVSIIFSSDFFIRFFISSFYFHQVGDPEKSIGGFPDHLDGDIKGLIPILQHYLLYFTSPPTCLHFRDLKIFPGSGKTGDDFWFHQSDEATGKWEIGYDDDRSHESCPLYVVDEWGNKDIKDAEFRCSEPGKYQADLFRITYGMFS